MAGACEAALVAGLAEIAFADHADFEPSDDCYGYLKPQAYLEEIARCRAIYGESLTIRAGIEIGEPHVYNRETAAFLSAHRFDLVLGSLHWVEGELALMGDYFASRTLEDGLRAYFAELALLAESADFDVLAHFDVVRRAAYMAFGLEEIDYRPFEEIIRRVLAHLVRRGRGLEVNTSSLRRRMGGLHPGLQILRWYREEGGQIVTLGSDAHRADSVGASLDEAAAAVRAAGFGKLAVYEDRKPSWLPLTQSTPVRAA
jgi:histidinol-phosphatase (PHP family)